MPGRHVIEVDHHQARKHRQGACGDVFQCLKAEGGRTVAVLADGLGSGIKAHVLASLTATMASRYAVGEVDLNRAAATIMSTLPVCSQRHIAYSTFTVVDMDRRGETRIVEFDNPACLVFRDGLSLDLERVPLKVPGADGREAVLHHLQFQAEPGDRVVVFSDGISQAGLGRRDLPLGWGREAARLELEQMLKAQPGLSARRMARALVDRAMALDGQEPKDDITCGVIHFRRPRELMILTGPPVHPERDATMAALARDFPGRKVACGGSTSGLLARELGLTLEMDLEALDPQVPPSSRMKGFDLVTEGAITLSVLARILEEEEAPELLRPHAATRLAALLLDSDVIHFVVGTRINEALQDPSFGGDLDLRRNLVRRLQRILTTRYLKDVQVRFL